MTTKQTQALAMRLSLAALALAMSAWTSTALAVTASVMTSVHLRAGPSTFYPSVAMLFTGTTVQVFGCEEAFNWCDVQSGLNRGWVAAAYLQAPAAGGPVIIANSGPTLGIPTATFVLNTYWGNYYRGWPWYARRPHYYNYWRRFPHGVPPPRPRPPFGRPPPARPPTPRPPPGMRPPPSRPPAPRPPPSRPPATRPPPQPRPNTTSSPGPGQ